MRLIDADELRGEVLHDNTYDNDTVNYYLGLIDSSPTIEPPVKRGEWVPVTNGRGGHECDACHEYAPSFQSGREHITKFCPHCGADMRTEV